MVGRLGVAGVELEVVVEVGVEGEVLVEPVVVVAAAVLVVVVLTTDVVMGSGGSFEGQFGVVSWKRDQSDQFDTDDQVKDSSWRDVQDSVHVCRAVQLSSHLSVHIMILPCRVEAKTAKGVVITCWAAMGVVTGAVVVENVVVIWSTLVVIWSTVVVIWSNFVVISLTAVVISSTAVVI